MESDEQIFRRALREVRQKKAQAQQQADLARSLGKTSLALSIESQQIAALDNQILAGLHGLASLGVQDE